MKALGAEIRRLRENRGMPLRVLAELTGMSLGRIHNIETGNYVRPLPDHEIANIAGVLGVEPQHLIRIRDAQRQESQDDAKTSGRDLLEYIVEEISDIHFLVQDGVLSSARLLDRSIRRLEDFREKYPSDKHRAEGLIAKARVLRLQAIIVTSTEDSIQANVRREQALLKPLQASLRTLDPENYDLAMVLPGIVAFIGQDMETAQSIFCQQLQGLTTSRPAAETVRSMAMIPAVLFDQAALNSKLATELFLRNEELALKTAKEDRVDAAGRLLIYEGLSFARGLLGLPGHEELLALAKGERQQALEAGTLFKETFAQAARTEFSNLIRNHDVDPGIVIASARHALREIAKFQNPRWRRQVVTRVVSHQNPQIQEFGRYLLLDDAEEGNRLLLKSPTDEL